MGIRLSHFLTMAAVLALIVSTAPVVSSAPRNMTTVFTSEYSEPEVKVIVPTTGQVFLNPHECTAWIGGEEENGQILSVPSSIANLSKMPLQVDVTVSANILDGSDMRLVSTSTKETTSLTKSAFMYFEMKNVNASLAENPDLVKWDGSYTEGTDVIVSNGTQRTRKNMVTLSGTNADGEVTASGSAAFHLDGDAVKNPKSPWNNKDGVHITVSFSFKPLPYS